jgi:YD repeat-containing protein
MILHKSSQQQAAAKNRKQHAILLVVACVFLLTHAAIVAEEAASLSEQSMLLKGEFSGAKSSLMSVSATTAPDWRISQLQDFASQYGEIMLSQGTLSLSETDLVLPGTNGLDLAITRTYDSRRFSDKSSYGGVSPLGGQMATAWGRGMAKGWGINLMMRAYVLNNALDNAPGGGKVGDPRYKKIMIESVDGIAEYYYDVSSGAYLSKQPNNHNRAYLASAMTYEKIMEPYSAFDMLGGDTTVIRLEMANGKTYIFSEFLVNFVIGNKNNINDRNQPWGRIEGYGLTDIYQGSNNIHFSYENPGVQDRNKLSWPLLVVAGMHLFEMADKVVAPRYGSVDNTGYQDLVEYKRVSAVTDTYGRVIRFSYLDNSNPRAESYGVVSQISYKGVNNSTENITYGYDSSLRLISVTQKGLPAKTYGYTPTDLGIGVKGKGAILSTIQTESGGQIHYDYHNMTPYPVVISKTITDPGKDTRAYSYTYTNMSGEPYKRQEFTPSWKPKGSYFFSTWDKPDSYFPSVTVSGGPNIQSMTALFEDDLPISETMGKYKVVSNWDKDKLRLLQVTQFLDQKKMTKTVYETFDSYGLPTQIREYEGGVAVRIHNTTYAYPNLEYADNPLWRWGRIYYLLGLPLQKKIQELATHKVQIYSYTVQDFQPKEIYEGEISSGKKLKTLTYDSKGRVTSETSYGPWGQTTATTVYKKIPTVYSVTQTVNGKSGVSEYSPYTGHLLKKTDANGLVVSYTYDNVGRLVKSKNPDGTEKTIAYSADMKTTSVTALGLTTTTTVDGLGRKVLIDRPSGMQDEKFEYYYANLPSKIYRQENGIWVLKKSYAYDSYLRKTSSTSPDFGTTSYAYDTPQMNTTTVTDSQGRQTVKYQNEAGQTMQTQFLATGVSESSLFTYNGFGQLLQTTDPRGLTHSATYDSYGRIIQSNHVNSTQKRSEPIYSSAGSGIVMGSNIYDRAGALYRNYSYDYDNEGRITALKVDNVTKETTTYDTATNAKGMVASVENDDAKTEYSYDSLSRLTEEKTTVKAANNREMAIGYAYNSESTLASISYPDGQAIKYGYDTLKRVNAVSYGSTNKSIAGYTYNENGTQPSHSLLKKQKSGEI